MLTKKYTVDIFLMSEKILTNGGMIMRNKMIDNMNIRTVNSISSFMILSFFSFGINFQIQITSGESNFSIDVDISNLGEKTVGNVLDQSKEIYLRLLEEESCITSLRMVSSIEKYEIEMVINFFKSQFDINLSSNLFQNKEIITSRFKVITKLLNDVQKQIKDLDIITQEEIEILDRNCVGETFEKLDMYNILNFISVAENNPDKIAVKFKETYITYRDLEYKTRKLAQYIYSNYGKGSLIGIILEKSVEYFIAILAIIRSGNAYVPLDIETLNPGHGIDQYPYRRLDFMIQDINPPFLISSSNFTQVCNRYSVPKIYLDNFNFFDLFTDFLPKIEDSDIIYGIYTSGSTGKPKVSIIKLESLSNLMASLDNYIYSLYGKDCILGLNAPFGFDASVQQFIGLLKGNTIDIIPPNVRMSGKQFVEYIKRRKINILDCTPSQMKVLMKCQINSVKTLKAVLVGGEDIPIYLWQKFKEIDSIDFYNVYGPTECTVDSTIKYINNSESKIPCIGKTVYNSNLFVLNDNMKKVPVGCQGDIYISGKCLSKGYFNRNNLNSKNFIYIELNHEKFLVYKTNDIAYIDEFGEIHYVCRKDKQIKIRSHRIELGEIEAAIKMVNGVEDVVVTVDNVKKPTNIIALVIKGGEIELTKDIILSSIVEILPMYMIPNTILFIDEIPRTGNGKIDYNALHDKFHEESREICMNPERIIFELRVLMSNLIEKDYIGDNDNFIEMGGDSLKIMTLLATVYNKYDIDIDFILFYANPTLSNLFKLIQEGYDEKKN